ncbi:MAG: MlaD family protein [Sphingomonadaceae bacterium]
METRANHFWVGIVTLALLALVAFFIVWLAGLNAGAQKQYDILFKTSVSGLAKGSQVSFAGVPVGQVSEIELWGKDPDYVRVRVQVQDDVPILVGTTATLQSSFTCLSSILLDGARADAPAISCETTACPNGVPLIPPKVSELGELMANAPMILERVATATERLNVLLSDENLDQFSSTMRNANKLTGELADSSPQVEKTLIELQGTLREANHAMASFEQVMGSADKLVGGEGVALAAQLRQTLKTADGAVQKLTVVAETAAPAASRLNDETLPNAEATLKDLRETTKALRSLTDQISNQGAGSLIKGQSLPEYKP